MNRYFSYFSKNFFYALMFLAGFLILAPFLPLPASAQVDTGAVKIAFLSDRDSAPGSAEIYWMNPDGSGQTRLTEGLELQSVSSHSLSGLEGRLAWSPQRQQFLYTTSAGQLYAVAPGGDGASLVAQNVNQFELSPDGTRVASYVMGGNIALTPLDGPDKLTLTGQSTRETLGLSADSTLLGAIWSPDGSKIAFQAEGDLFVMNADGSEPVRLTSGLDVAAFNFDWSPDGRNIAFYTFEGPNLYLLDVQTARMALLVENGFSPAWSPDGSKIAFTRSDGQIWTVNPNGTGLARLTVQGHNCCAVWVSTGMLDQDQIAAGPVTIAPAGQEGGDTAVEPPWRSGMSITADGRYIAFSSGATDLIPGDTNGLEDVFIYDRETGQTERVSVASDGVQANGRSASPAVSADGAYVVFASEADNLVSDDTNETWDIFIHDRTTGQTERISTTSGAQANGRSASPAISADGRYVAFSSEADNLIADDTNETWDLFVYDRETGQTSRISVADTSIFPAAPAADSQSDQISEVAAEVPPPPRPTPVIVQAPAPFTPPPAPTPTPALVAQTYRLAYSKWDGGRHNLYISDTDGSSEHFILHNGAGPSWANDGQTIFFYGEPSVNFQRRFAPGETGCEFPEVSDGLVAIGVPTPPRDICQAQTDVYQALDWKVGTARWARVSPDGTMVAYDARLSGDWRIYFLGNDENQQFRFEILGEQAAWSPDSQKLVYRSTQFGRTGIWISNRDDSGHVMITDTGSDSFPAWSPDGQTVAFSREVGGNVDIYTMNTDGTNVQRLTTAIGPDTLPTYTPDGQIIFRSARSGSWGIWKMNSDGSNQQEIIPDAPVGPDWSYSRMDVLGH